MLKEGPAVLQHPAVPAAMGVHIRGQDRIHGERSGGQLPGPLLCADDERRLLGHGLWPEDPVHEVTAALPGHSPLHG